TGSRCGDSGPVEGVWQLLRGYRRFQPGSVPVISGVRAAGAVDPGWRACEMPVSAIPLLALRALEKLEPQTSQCRNKNSLEFKSAKCTSSQALRLSAGVAFWTWASAALISPSAGARDSVA